MDKRTTHTPLILTIALLLLTIYVGSYLALVKPIRGIPGSVAAASKLQVAPANQLPQNWFVYPAVRQFGSDRPLSMFYRPMEWLDERIRPDSWWWEPRKTPHGQRNGFWNLFGFT